MSYQTLVHIRTRSSEITMEIGSRRLGLWAGCGFPDEEGRCEAIVHTGHEAKMQLEAAIQQAHFSYPQQIIATAALVEMANYIEDCREHNEEILALRLIEDNFEVSFKLIG